MSTPGLPARSLRWAWIAIAALAIASRLIGLGATPLTPSEAARAVVAWDAASGRGWPDASESPLLLVGNALLFTVFHTTEWAARLLPALAGIALVGLPYLWRRDLGEIGALVAASLLLISPLSLFAARQVDGAAVASLGAWLILTVVFARTGANRGAGWLAGGLALGLTGGPAFYDALIAGGVTWLLLRRSDSTNRSYPSWPWRRALTTGLGIAVVISVAAGFRWAGWSGVLDGAAAWLREWRTWADRGLSPLALLLLYEPVALILAVSGLGLLTARAGRERQPKAPWELALLGSVTALLIAVRPGGSPADLSLAIVPLALFGGWAGGRLWGDLTRQERRWMGLHSLVSGLFWVPGLLALAQNARGLIGTDQIVLILLGIVVLVALQVLLVFIFLMQLPLPLILRSTLTGLSAMFLLLQIGFAAGLAYVRSDQAIEPARHTAGSRNLAHMTDMLLRIAVEREERADSLQVSLLDQDGVTMPTLRWALRDFGNVTPTVDWPEDPGVLVIAPETSDLSGVAADRMWQGMRFVASTTYTAPLPRCQLVPLNCSEALRWYLYRESPHPATPTNVILWRTAGPH